MHRLNYAEWSVAEYASALAAILSGRVQTGAAVKRLRDRIGDVLDCEHVYLVNAGRTAIRIALQVFQQRAPERNCVIIPAYICPAVIEAVKACGLTPISVDIDDDLNIRTELVAEAIDRRTLAVIAAHMYGAPAKIAELERSCRAEGVFLIDDAAQVVGVPHQGRFLGRFGDAGVISFAQSKSVVTGVRGSGGVLLVNNSDLVASAREKMSGLQPATGRLRQFVHFVLRYRWAAYTGLPAYYCSRVLDRLFGSQTNKDYFIPARMSNLDATIALQQFNKIDTLRRERMRLSRLYFDALAAVPDVVFPQYAPDIYLSRILCLLPPSVDLPKVRERLRKRGVITRRGYKAYDPKSQAPKARSVAERLLEVPSHSAMTQQDIHEVCRALRDVLSKAERCN